MTQDPHSVIQTIRLSEKATRLGEENNEYVFIVARCDGLPIRWPEPIAEMSERDRGFRLLDADFAGLTP